MHPFMQKSLQMLLENHWMVKSAIRYMYALGKTGTQQRLYYSLSHYLTLFMYTVVYLFRNFTKIYTGTCSLDQWFSKWSISTPRGQSDYPKGW